MSEPNESIEEEIRQLVIERLKAMPPDKKISIGSEGSFTNEQMIAFVKKDDEIGQKIIEVQMSYLRALKTGALLDE